MVFHEQRLIYALIKYGNISSENYYWDEMDMESTQTAITMAQIPENVKDYIWEKKRVLGEMF